jgi:hypothetical protein
LLIPGKSASRFGRRGSAIGIGTVEEVVVRGPPAREAACTRCFLLAVRMEAILGMCPLPLGQALGCAGWSAHGLGTQYLLWGVVPGPEPVALTRGFWPCPGPWDPDPVPASIRYSRDPLSSCTSPNIASCAWGTNPPLCPDPPSLHGVLPSMPPWGPSPVSPKELVACFWGLGTPPWCVCEWGPPYCWARAFPAAVKVPRVQAGGLGLGLLFCFPHPPSDYSSHGAGGRVAPLKTWLPSSWLEWWPCPSGPCHSSGLNPGYSPVVWS